MRNENFIALGIRISNLEQQITVLLRESIHFNKKLTIETTRLEKEIVRFKEVNVRIEKENDCFKEENARIKAVNAHLRKQLESIQKRL